MAEIEIGVEDHTLRRIDELADAMGHSRSCLVNDALTRYLKDVGPRARKLREAMAELDRGEGIPHEQVMAGIGKKIAARQP